MLFTKFIQILVPLDLELWSSKEIHCRELNLIFKIEKIGEVIKLKFCHLYDGKIVMAIQSNFKNKNSFRVPMNYFEKDGKHPLKTIDL